MDNVIPEIISACMHRFLGVPLPAKPYTRKAKTITPKKPKVEAPKERAPVVTFGSNELSARRYNAPQLNVTPERLEKLKIELQKEAQAEEEKRAAAIKTYEADLERLKSCMHAFFG